MTPAASPPFGEEDDLRRCLTYSLALHLGVLGLALLLGRAVAEKVTKTYMIDFVGPSAAILMSQPEPQAARGPATYSVEPQSEPDEFSHARRRKGAPLPRPSLLRGWQETPVPETPPAQPPAAEAAPTETAGAASQAGIATDLPDFPYPWYISQLRQSLWAQWSSRMPKEKGDCVVVFTLLPNGRMTDLRTEESSGDPAFDLAALSAVQDAGPFPPLPRGFREPFLKIHVTLKAL